MAQRRMFNKTVTNSDNFLDMPDSSQNLYFHLSMNADDDGFVDNWKSIMRMTGHKEDDLKVLIAKQYIIPFESGVIVIRHWRLNNYLQKDRIIETNYIDEKQLLTTDKNNVYNLDTECIHSIDKYSIEENSIDNKYIVEQIVDYLNEKCKTSYKSSTKKTNQLINARLNEGFSKEDFFKVIDIKSNQWLDTNMEVYLRPETLFGTKFESYLNQKPKETLPDWYGKQFEKEQITDEEAEELKEMFKEFD